jgi:hypothetical protein
MLGRQLYCISVTAGVLIVISADELENLGSYLKKDSLLLLNLSIPEW